MSDIVLRDLAWLKASYEIDNRLARARSADDPTLSDDVVSERVREMINFHIFFDYCPIQSARVFRARALHPGTEFNNTRDLWYPPIEYCKLGRFNQENKPRLYLCGNGSSAIAEIGGFDKGKYVVAEYEFDNFPLCQMIGMTKSNSNELRKYQVDLTGRGFSNLAEIRRRLSTSRCYDLTEDYFSELATRTVTNKDQYKLYRPSASLADAIFNKNGTYGIMYPSNASLYCSTNFCISADYADDHAKIVKLWEVECVIPPKRPENIIESIEVMSWWKLNRCTSNIASDGEIDWSNFDASVSQENELYDIGIGAHDSIIYGPYKGEDGYKRLADERWQFLT